MQVIQFNLTSVLVPKINIVLDLVRSTTQIRHSKDNSNS